MRAKLDRLVGRHPSSLIRVFARLRRALEHNATTTMMELSGVWSASIYLLVRGMEAYRPDNLVSFLMGPICSCRPTISWEQKAEQPTTRRMKIKWRLLGTRVRIIPFWVDPNFAR